MVSLVLSQAVRDAVEVERAASRFYRSLLPKAADARARTFLERMIAEEDEHARSFEEIGRKLESGALLEGPAGRGCRLVETAPEWVHAEEITYREALDIALEAEIHAELYYSAVADSLGEGPVFEFFNVMARGEAAHVRRLEKMLRQLEGEGEQRA